ncbi:hypothetical protein MKK68_18760 [Methylobacterium sp. E-016]|uniref:hypothetical protein n=1 Tax=Methylobacterium sp. E-016 TaxID=2836556 RepID=UPI001FB9B91B|nr:hypothetical protein [Methylobacterium sp. E-016]MCJ2077665.1 hypothetical protein [Methylobacterium sp. E-016]
MGTSSSARGASGRSALVPPHADTDPTLPLPAPVGNRFQTFRTVFGRFCEGGGRGSVRSALGHYARTSTGGSSIGPRRFGPAYAAGGSLFGLLGDLRAGGDGATFAGVDLSGLVGRTVGFAAQEIARALAPENEDADRIRVAIHEAIAEVLPDVEIFDPTAMTADQVIAVLVDFLARVLFRQVTEDAGSAWNKAPSADRTIQAENELFDLIKVAMDRHLGPALAGGVGSLRRAQVERLQQHAMTEVWREWEAYE